MPELSLITVAFNSASTIERTIQSVESQDSTDFEYIVIDGGSSDGTREIVERHARRVDHFVSEPDRGLYDAMNKGWRLASGKVIGFLNSDDRLADSTCLSSVLGQFSRTGSDAVYGDLDIVDSRDRLLRRWRSGNFHRMKYHLGWMAPHPSTYVSRSLFERYGGFRDDLRIGADYELMLRFFYKHRARVSYLPKTLVHMTAGGASNGSLKGIARANWEVYRSWGLNGLHTLPSIVLTKPLSKLFQLRYRP